jgi:hypothetical protein
LQYRSTPPSIQATAEVSPFHFLLVSSFVSDIRTFSGPVLSADDEVIGVAFQSLSSEDTENIGYVVPVNVIQHFLESVARYGNYSGVAGLGAKMQVSISTTLNYMDI